MLWTVIFDQSVSQKSHKEKKMIKRIVRKFSEKVRFSLNGKNVEFPSFWLLDNDNYMTETVQRQFPTFEKWGKELPKVHSIDDNEDSGLKQSIISSFFFSENTMERRDNKGLRKITAFSAFKSNF